jgi:hypothetical protein
MMNGISKQIWIYDHTSDKYIWNFSLDIGASGVAKKYLFLLTSLLDIRTTQRFDGNYSTTRLREE